MRKLIHFFLEYGIVIIITIPAFVSLINPYYFSHHDSQHAARLFVLTEAIAQGAWYPRWVDLFGFNYGYPLFNFYPPLIYYVGALFFGLGFSILWSVKMVVIVGYVFAAIGMYLLVKGLLKRRLPAYLAAVLYTFFTYHAVVVYVRGALAEFFTMTILPFLLLSLESLRTKPTLRSSGVTGLFFAALIATHPLIAFPSVLFIAVYMTYSWITHSQKIKYTLHATLGIIGGLLGSAFFWLPSMLERKFTLVDSILLKELASYEIHFVQPDQLWFSPWGYGGSGPGYSDAMTFQLGKLHIGIVMVAAVFFITLMYIKRRKTLMADERKVYLDFGFFFALMALSIVMMLEVSKPVWQTVSFLHYLQFPWRFLTFAGIFVSIVGAYGIYFLSRIYTKQWLIAVVVVVVSLGCIITYQKYFKPERYLYVTDRNLTSFEEIAWRVSRTSFEFVPAGVKTTKSDLNTTILDMDENRIARNKYQLTNGIANVSNVRTKFHDKQFTIDVFSQSVLFRLNTYNFPGWTAYIDGMKTTIQDNNPQKLITITVPKGRHTLRFVFQDTPVRAIANMISLVSVAGIFMYLVYPSIAKMRNPTKQ